jgi:hypothetical protein
VPPRRSQRGAPSVVSVLQATETGAVYTLDEFHPLGPVAKEAGLRLATFATTAENVDNLLRAVRRCGI